MSHIKSYQLVEQQDYSRFILEVNELLDKGWELHGPTQVIESCYKNEVGMEIFTTTRCQAMVLLGKNYIP